MNGKATLTAIVFLGTIVLGCLAIVGILVLNDKTVPDSIIAIGSAAGGSLGTVIVPKLGASE